MIIDPYANNNCLFSGKTLHKGAYPVYPEVRISRLIEAILTSHLHKERLVTYLDDMRMFFKNKPRILSVNVIITSAVGHIHEF